MSSIAWRPKTDKLEQLIQQEEARIAVLTERKLAPEISKDISLPRWSPEQIGISPTLTPQITQTLFPVVDIPQPVVRTIPQITTPAIAAQKPVQKAVEEKPVEVPIWQRALEIFSAPFEWVDKTIIKPGLALAGTGLGVVEEVERKPGEDFWEWKKRSWEGWEAPGVDINVPWSDKPRRVDLKGVLSFAPWLLIPGAGQVGTAIRAGVGIAGALGKAGKAGRIIGTVVEYSPWGFAEKTAGVAIKGGIRAVGEVSEKVSTKIGEKLFGKYVPPPMPPEIAELTTYMAETVGPAMKLMKKALPQELRVKQEAITRALQKDVLEGRLPIGELRAATSKALSEIGSLRPKFAITPEALAARKAEKIADIESKIANGEYTESVGKALITKVERSREFEVTPFTQDKVNALNETIMRASEDGLLNMDAQNALTDLLLGVADNLPEPHHIKVWADAFGFEFAKAMRQFTSPQQANNFFDALQIGKSLVSTADLSGTFRQGLFFGLLHPTLVPKWFGRQVKALLSEKLTWDMDDALRARPAFKKWQNRGAYFAPQRDISFAKAEEAFPSRLAERIPGVKRSQRAFNTYLNEARLDILERAEASMVAQGAGDAELKMFADFVNYASGRGTLPKSLDKYMPALNAVLFSPRLQAATLQLPRQIGRMMLSDNPYMRKQGALALVTFVGGGAGLLALLNATGVAKVENDPRSGDFGKIKIGDTRLDIWRGYIQYVRFAAQLLAGERKSAYGNMNKAERGEIAGRFLQSKMSPAAGLILDLWRGEDYQGKPVFSDTTGFSAQVGQRVLPLALQDVIDAMEMNGINGAWVAAPATLGIGALTYVNDFVKIKERIAKEMGFESWDDIDPKTQREIQNRNAEFQAASIAFDRQVMGTAWGDWHLAGNTIEDVFRQNVDNAVREYQQTKDGVQFNEKVTEAFTARRGGYDAREKEERFSDIVKRLKTNNMADALVNLGPEQLAIKIYNDALYGDDMSDEFGNYRFDEANIRKEQLRLSLGQEMYDYIQDYIGVKYETLPDEFQELMRARETMKPYWQVRDRVIKLFGERYAESSRGSQLISKLRKQKRLASPDMELAFQTYFVKA